MKKSIGVVCTNIFKNENEAFRKQVFNEIMAFFISQEVNKVSKQDQADTTCS